MLYVYSSALYIAPMSTTSVHTQYTNTITRYLAWILTHDTILISPDQYRHVQHTRFYDAVSITVHAYVENFTLGNIHIPLRTRQHMDHIPSVIYLVPTHILALLC